MCASDSRVRRGGLAGGLDSDPQREGLGEVVATLQHPLPSRWVSSFSAAPALAHPPDPQATVDSGWSLVEPSHDIFPAGQQPPHAVLLGLRKRGDKLEVGGKSGERLFDFGIKHTEAMGIMAQESTAQALI